MTALRVQLGRSAAAIILAAATVVVSLAVAWLVNGSLLRSVSLIELRRYGGTTFEDLRHLELWRLALAQLLHAKLPHMIFNALCLLLLGSLLEGRIGPARLLALWLVAGGAATAISPILIAPPFDVGTGASQAVFAFAGCAGVFAAAGAIDRPRAITLTALALGPGLLLDQVAVGYPKPGHVAGLVFGALLGLAFLAGRLRSEQA